MCSIYIQRTIELHLKTSSVNYRVNMHSLKLEYNHQHFSTIRLIKTMTSKKKRVMSCENTLTSWKEKKRRVHNSQTNRKINIALHSNNLACSVFYELLITSKHSLHRSQSLATNYPHNFLYKQNAYQTKWQTDNSLKCVGT